MTTNTLSKRDKMYQDIKEHGENLNAIFNTGLDPITLCKKLHRLEVKVHHATTCLCNTNTMHLLELNRFTGYDVKQATDEEQDLFFDKIKEAVYKILGDEARDKVFINYDPRGYALKIREDFVSGKNIHKDWGGFGILAPDFSN